MSPRFTCLSLGMALMVCMQHVSLCASSNAPDNLDLSVQASIDAFVVPEGFEINLWAAEPLLHKPVQMNWDAQGRLWVVCSMTYPQIAPGEKARDQIVVLEDTDADGQADKSTVFADDLHIPTAIIPMDGGCYVANSTEILFLKDTDGDGKADSRRVILSGFGTEDTHHLIHTFRRSPEGLLNFNQSIYIHSHVETPRGTKRLMGGGIWNFRPQSMHLDVFAKGLVNSWGYEFDRWGQSFATDGAGSEGINYMFPGSVYATSPGAKRIMRGLNPGQPKHCGLEIISEPHFPDDWQESLVTCDFRGNRLNRFVVTRQGSTYQSQQMPDVLASRHRGFRPVDVRTGPDGALYIADWFNPIIQHGEVDFRDERRDRTRGRIWRLKAKDRALTEKRDFQKADVAQLVELAFAERRWDRQFAVETLQQRDVNEAVQLLTQRVEQLLTQQTDIEQRDLLALRGIWALEGLNHHSVELTTKLTQVPTAPVRSAALRVLSQRYDQNPQAFDSFVKGVGDADPQVRLWALGGLYFSNRVEALPAALKALDQTVDEPIDFLVDLISREHADLWLPQLGNQDWRKQMNQESLIYALLASGRSEALDELLAMMLKSELSLEQVRRGMTLATSVANPNQAQTLLQIARQTPDLAITHQIMASLTQLAKRGVLPEQQREEALKDWLQVTNKDVLATALELAGAWKSVASRELLLQVLKESTETKVQEAAILGLTLLGGEDTLQVLLQLSEDSTHPSGQLSAIRGLLKIDPKLAMQKAVAFLAAKPELAQAQNLFGVLLSNKDWPDLLIEALKDQQLSPEIATEGIRIASTRGVTSALESALREAGKIQAMKAELTVDEMQALVRKVQTQGNAKRGEEVYRRDALMCMVCHAIGGSGGLIGPDLISIGGSAPIDYLIESLLNPNAKIKEGYHMTMVTTKAGNVVAGAIAQDTGTELLIRDAGNQVHSVRKEDITQNVISPVSMMPPGLTAGLREDEFVDLVRFMSELGKEGDYKMPSERLIRNWQTLAAIDEDKIDEIRHLGLASLNQPSLGLPWLPKLSAVNGAVPLNEMLAHRMHPWFPRAIMRTGLKLEQAGKVKLRLSEAHGVIVAMNENLMLDPQANLEFDLAAGVHSLTILLKQDYDVNKAFTVEIVEGAVEVVPAP